MWTSRLPAASAVRPRSHYQLESSTDGPFFCSLCWAAGCPRSVISLSETTVWKRKANSSEIIKFAISSLTALQRTKTKTKHMSRQLLCKFFFRSLPFEFIAIRQKCCPRFSMLATKSFFLFRFGFSSVNVQTTTVCPTNLVKYLRYVNITEWVKYISCRMTIVYWCVMMLGSLYLVAIISYKIFRSERNDIIARREKSRPSIRRVSAIAKAVNMYIKWHLKSFIKTFYTMCLPIYARSLLLARRTHRLKRE